MEDLGYTIGNLKLAIVKTESPYKEYMIEAVNHLIDANNTLLDLVEKYPDLEKFTNRRDAMKEYRKLILGIVSCGDKNLFRECITVSNPILALKGIENKTIDIMFVETEEVL